LPKYLKGDALYVYKILLNILGNALKFTSVGSVSLDVKQLESKLSGNQVLVRFTITDTGVGIAESERRAIFNDFYKSVDSRTSDGQSGVEAGRGLGLGLARQYAEAMNGEVYLSWSKAGEGSQFRVVLPFEISLDQED
jgi:signal transduction histidine kinase